MLTAKLRNLQQALLSNEGWKRIGESLPRVNDCPCLREKMLLVGGLVLTAVATDVITGMLRNCSRLCPQKTYLNAKLQLRSA